MRRKLLVLAAVICSLTGFSQDFSNKGRDFWVGYGSHCDMYNANGTLNATGGGQDMVLYFATEALTTVTVSIPGLGYTQTYSNIAANTIFETPAIPKTGVNDARLGIEGSSSKGVHISSDQPIVAYAHIYNGARSGATLLFPTNTLGKEYYSLNMSQNSQQAYSYCYFYAVATDTGTTTIQVTPIANTQTMIAGQTYTYNLTQGQVFNALGQITGNSGVDLTGSKIESIATGTGNCKPIAFFSGSGKINLNCPVNGGGSADNYIVQSFPKTAWGKNYLTVPTAGMPFNYFRIAVSDPAAVVKLNGVTLGGLINNFYYQIAATNQPNYIQSDKPVMVAQYITTSGACGNNVGIPTNEGDPEVIYLSSIEQNISRVLLYSTPHSAINEHFISVMIPNGGTGVSSFRLDGVIPSSPFVVHPQNSNYSYLQQAVTVGTHVLQSDSGFNASAYGYGIVESYGYNAGTNIKDLFTFITPINPLNISTNVTACTGTPFYFSVTLPKHPDSLTYLTWDFHNNPPGSPYPNVTQTAPLIPDATYFIGSTQVWRYKLPTLYTYSPAGVYPITITAGTLTTEGCGNSFIIDRDLYVYDPPVLGFNWTNNGCVTDLVAFDDTTNYAPGTYPYMWWWDFGDGNYSALKSPTHLYATAGTYTVRLATVTNVGCLSDTATRTITVTNVPVPKFGVSSPRCDGFPVTFTDSSTVSAPGVLVKWYWDYGDGIKDTLGTGINRIHTYRPWGMKTARLKVESNSGCQSSFIDSFYVGPIPVVNFLLPPGICMPADSAHFFDLSIIADGSQSGFSYKWHFGDPPSGLNDSSVLKNPAHYYTNTGPFTINLQVTSNVGCVHDTSKTLSTVYAQAHSDFLVNPENCLRDSTAFTSNATGSGSAIMEWHWDFGDGNFSTLTNPKHVYATIGVKTIKHWVVTDKGCYSDTTTHIVLINPLPTANFNFSAPSCETKQIIFSDASVANAGTLANWQWNFDDPASGANNISSLQNPTHIFGNWGTYDVKLVARSTKGCYSDTFARQVIIHPQPIPGFISPEVCLSDAFAQFVDTSNIANGSIISWSWNFGDPASGPLNTSNLQNPQHRYNAIGFYTAKLIVTSNNGCIDSVSQTFTVNGDIPVANFNALNPANLCANDSVAVQDASTVNFGNVTKLEIYWDNVGAPLVFQTEDNPYPGIIIKHLYPNFQAPPNKTFSIRYKAYSGATCINEITKTIVVNAAPKVQFTPLQPICLDGPQYQITEASEVGGVPPGTFIFTGPGVSPTGLFNPAIAGPGTHRILYTFTSNVGNCVDTASQTITVWDPPVADFKFSTPRCEKDPITFKDTSRNTVGTLTTWRWDFADGTPVQIRNNNAPFIHIFNNYGTYNVTLKVTTSNGCVSTVKSIPVVVKPQPHPNFKIPVSVCLPNAIVTFNNVSDIADGTENAFTYLWDLGDPPSGPANSSTAQYPTHTYNSTGPFTITLQVTSGAGCIRDTPIVLNTVHPKPFADFRMDKPSVCIGDVVTFSDQSNPLDGTVIQWYWKFGDGVVDSNTAVITHAYPHTITYFASLYIVNSNGCRSDTMTKPFTVYPYPVVNAGPDRYVLEGGSIIIQAVATGNDLQYLWTPNIYLDSNKILTPMANNLLDDVTYTLTVTARGGCVSTDGVFVKLLRAPQIPNTFTPNNDGINDVWTIGYLDTYPDNRVQVFTRTGQLVFESHGYGKPWDGTIKGKPLPFDTYYYIIEPNNGRKPITGYVTIIK